MSLYEVPYACMQFHELARRSIKFNISLSEQLTRTSQCLFLLSFLVQNIFFNE